MEETRPVPFAPDEQPQLPSDLQVPNDDWVAVIKCACAFPSEIFEIVMLNLIKNPNIVSSCLFRADIIFDDHNEAGNPTTEVTTLLSDEQPKCINWPGFDRQRTIVRRFVPRNPQLDRSMIQTCHIYTRQTSTAVEHLVVYIPHVTEPEEIPFYHPSVRSLAFLHTTPFPSSSTPTSPASITILYEPYTSPLTSRLTRTALRLLQTVHKHGHGQQAGYEKRVHHDVLIPQARYQNTYTRLKNTYGRALVEKWVEVTDPSKHVFEDLGIAAFLLELWGEMYALPREEAEGKVVFPGFVDIGCGNGVLVYILCAEGYEGWGFDARERKTWSIFPEDVRKRLQRRVLVPKVLKEAHRGHGETESNDREVWHDGMFTNDTVERERNVTGPFIISNHADELTAWTPLLAYLNHSAFIAIPCCSHDLSGTRFRAPVHVNGRRLQGISITRLPQQVHEEDKESTLWTSKRSQAAETGSLKRTDVQKKMPSAYASLCAYVAHLTEEVHLIAEQEVLRIPSTRNTCIVGRKAKSDMLVSDDLSRLQDVTCIVEREMKSTIEIVARDWILRAEQLMKKPGSGH